MSRHSSSHEIRRAQKTVWLIVVILCVSAGIAVWSIAAGPQIVFSEKSPIRFSPRGYTVSLVLFVLPLLALLHWLHKRQDDVSPERVASQKAFWTTAGIVIPMYCLLDLFLANTFFVFPHRDATLEIYVWGRMPGGGWPQSIPIEEFLFYITGFLAILLTYIWCDHYWLSEYHMEVKTPEKPRAEAILKFSLPSVLIGLALAAGAILYKKNFSEYPEGLPGYMLFLIFVILVPTSVLYRYVSSRLNLRAFSFTIIVLLLISLLWEVTLALPYQWWDFQRHQMMGIFIKPWYNLPIEEPILWIGAGWLNVSLYKVIYEIYLRRQVQQELDEVSPEPLRELLFRPRAVEGKEDS